MNGVKVEQDGRVIGKLNWRKWQPESSVSVWECGRAAGDNGYNDTAGWWPEI